VDLTQGMKNRCAWETSLKKFKIRREERKERGREGGRESLPFTLRSHLPSLFFSFNIVIKFNFSLSIIALLSFS